MGVERESRARRGSPWRRGRARSGSSRRHAPPAHAALHRPPAERPPDAPLGRAARRDRSRGAARRGAREPRAASPSSGATRRSSPSPGRRKGGKRSSRPAPTSSARASSASSRAAPSDPAGSSSASPSSRAPACASRRARTGRPSRRSAGRSSRARGRGSGRGSHSSRRRSSAPPRPTSPTSSGSGWSEEADARSPAPLPARVRVRPGRRRLPPRRRCLCHAVAAALRLARAHARRPAGIDLVVAQDGSGDFATVQAALDALPPAATRTRVVLVRNGVYREKLFVTKSRVAIVGEDREKTRIEYAQLRREWRATHPDDWGAAVVNVGDDVTDLLLANLTIRNDYGSRTGDHDHQFAIRSGGSSTRIVLLHANVLADGGDTVSLWNAFTGMTYHASCTFEGWVDFVCPRGTSYVTNSRFVAHNMTAAIWHDGSKDRDHRFVVRSSRFDGDPGFPLGRNNRDGQFYLLDCAFSGAMADQPDLPALRARDVRLGAARLLPRLPRRRRRPPLVRRQPEGRRLLAVPGRDHAGVDLLRTVGPRGDDARGPAVRRGPEAARRGDRKSRPSGPASAGSRRAGRRATSSSSARAPSRRRVARLDAATTTWDDRSARRRHALRVARRRDRAPRAASAARRGASRPPPARSGSPSRATPPSPSGRAGGPASPRASAPGPRSRTTRSGGRSTKSFVEEGHWEEVLAERPDVVLIQFGHNDAPGKGPERETDAFTTYRENLARMVDEARAAGARPVLLTLAHPALRRRGGLRPVGPRLLRRRRPRRRLRAARPAPRPPPALHRGRRPDEPLGGRRARRPEGGRHPRPDAPLARRGARSSAASSPRSSGGSSPTSAPAFEPPRASAAPPAAPATAPGDAGGPRAKPNVRSSAVRTLAAAPREADRLVLVGRGGARRARTSSSGSARTAAGRRTSTWPGRSRPRARRRRSSAARTDGHDDRQRRDVHAGPLPRAPLRRRARRALPGRRPPTGSNSSSPRSTRTAAGPSSSRSATTTPAHVTFNDGAMAGALELLLDDLGRGASRSAASTATAAPGPRGPSREGSRPILAAQVVAGGTRTAWCAQHDEVTLAPRPARAFEPVALASSESVGVVRFLMSLPRAVPRGRRRGRLRRRLAPLREDRRPARRAPARRRRSPTGSTPSRPRPLRAAASGPASTRSGRTARSSAGGTAS